MVGSGNEDGTDDEVRRRVQLLSVWSNHSGVLWVHVWIQASLLVVECRIQREAVSSSSNELDQLIHYVELSWMSR